MQDKHLNGPAGIFGALYLVARTGVAVEEAPEEEQVGPVDQQQGLLPGAQVLLHRCNMCSPPQGDFVC